MSQPDTSNSFQSLGLRSEILKAIEHNGYETPSPIQRAAIPAILNGRDVLGQAQTGTGKTAAFALPILSRLDLKAQGVQVLVLTPTRELAIQVAEAMQNYARALPGFHVLPIYGGQSYGVQLRQLKRGVHAVVGTPGRVMDHMNRGTLKLDALRVLVLDEADEMLRMGFIDDINWILEQMPDSTQRAMFSATMPKPIQRIAMQHLRSPEHVRIESKTVTASNIRQRHWLVSGLHKLDALTRVLETEDSEGVLIFVRTKMATEELAEKLKARGFLAEALNGDMVQKQRERLVEKFKSGDIDVLIGTDVVGRGLDVDRITHVINYDIPYDTESYVHRIGRTGRAGRTGEAILFVSRREKRMLGMIEKATGQPIEAMQMPSIGAINRKRIENFTRRLLDTVATVDLEAQRDLLSGIARDAEISPMHLAAALMHQQYGEHGLLLDESTERPGSRPQATPSPSARSEHTGALPLKDHPDIPMQRFALNAGHAHRVKPGNIVGMIANEAELEPEFIGHIEIYAHHSTVDLPEGMPAPLLQRLRKARVCGRKSLLAPEESFKPIEATEHSGRGKRHHKSRKRPKR